tara:strand:+ start:347 stop:583 length:237 start_codon:yes stop_codon:yes gene_type:complete
MLWTEILDRVGLWIYIFRVSHLQGVTAVNKAFDIAIRAMFCVILVSLMMFGFTVAIPVSYLIKRVVIRVLLIGETNEK